MAERYGKTNNLFVVPNPVELPTLPDPMPEREPATFAIVSRLETQKRLDHAIRAFAHVVEARPQAKLLIYGKGVLETNLNNLIEELGMSASILMCGHDPQARDQLLSATAFLMTSTHEGYPLAPLESMSRGCPVISYDIKYGPREQITDGVDGFLVPSGDLESFSERVIQLIDDPNLVRRMSSAALLKAQDHDHGAFLRDWRQVLESVVENRPFRVEATKVACEVTELGYRPALLPNRIAGLRAHSASFRRSPRLRLSASLKVVGRWRKGDHKRVVITLDAVSSTTGAVTSIPLTVSRERRVFSVSTEFDMADAFAGMDENDNNVQLRLRLVFRNYAWQTNLHRPTGSQPNYEIVYGATGTPQLRRSPALHG